MRVVWPDDRSSLIAYGFPALLAQPNLDLFAAAALVFIDNHFIQVRLRLKTVAQFAPVQVEQTLVEIMQSRLQDIAVKTGAKASAEKLVLKDSTVYLAAAAKPEEECSGSDAHAWKVRL